MKISNPTCILGIRVNPQVHTGAPEMFDVSRNESKFGVPVSNAEAILEAALAHPVQALHMHSGSQMKDLGVQRQALISLKQLADQVNAVESGANKWLFKPKNERENLNPIIFKTTEYDSLNPKNTKLVFELVLYIKDDNRNSR